MFFESQEDSLILQPKLNQRHASLLNCGLIKIRYGGYIGPLNQMVSGIDEEYSPGTTGFLPAFLIDFLL